MNKSFLIPKDPGFENAPESFKMKITYINGKVDEFDVADRFMISDINAMEILTIDDIRILICLTNVIKIEYDLAFSKLIYIRQKILAEQEHKQ